ncbi:MAG: Lipid export ATP-binding/permease protein MsbA [Myxococcaceae bacterium]|nr:Lipid export ATP-binding/permease protein MsbA [Myxococcaceae bacterium]
MSNRSDALFQADAAVIEPSASATNPAFQPIRALLRYLPRHRRDAYLTMTFGVLGFFLSFAYPWIIGSAVDLASEHGGAGAARLAGARAFRLAELSAATALLHALVVYGRGHCNVRLGEAIVTDLRQDLYAHLQSLSVRFYARERTGAILARVLHDVQDATTLLYMGILVAAMDGVQLVLALVLMAQLNTKLTLACALVFPLYASAFLLLNPRVRTASERVRKNLGAISGNMTERLAGQALIKTCTAEQREAESFSREVKQHFALAVAQSHQGHLVSAVGELLVHVGTTIVVGYGGYLAIHGELTPGQLTRFLGYMVILYAPVRRFAELNITYQVSLSAIRRVFRVFDIRPAIVEHPWARREPPRAGAVSFEQVRFRYADGSDEARARLEEEDITDAREASEAHRISILPGDWVLDDVTLHAAPGERIAVIGPSGSGKSTLLSLVPRLYDVSQGRVLIDGVDTRDYGLSALRSAIAVVQQDSFVFTGSILDNLAYGRPDATEAEIIEAAKAAHAHEFISKLPEGYKTKLGERGVNLSGGQRQRLSIARALLRDPRILILDEATSSLDTDSESVVQEALERLMVGRTCFIIAHRLSTIRHADRIAVLADGRLVEVGPHRELLARGGRYARMVQRQSARPEPQLSIS